MKATLRDRVGSIDRSRVQPARRQKAGDITRCRPVPYLRRLSCWVLCLAGLLGPLEAAVRTWTGAAGDNTWSTAGNWTGNAAPGTEDDVSIPVGSGPIVLNGGVGVRSLLNRGTIRLVGVLGSNASLAVAAASENSGSIFLGSTRSDRSSTLSTGPGARLLNTATGRIEAVAESGGGRQINASIVNQGVLAATGIAVGFTGAYEVAGGKNSGQVEFRNIAVRITASPAEPVELTLYGDNTRLLTDVLSGVTLRVLSDLGANAQLSVPQNVANHGAIALDSLRSDRTSRLTLDPTATLLVAGDGVLDVVAGSGGLRTFTGALRNEGSLRVAPGVSLTLNATGRNFTQKNGTIAASGPLVQVGGRFDFLGGKITGAFIGENVEVFVDAGISTAAEVFVRGTDCKLVNLLSPAITLHLTTDVAHHAILTTVAGAVNKGHILLGSTRSDRFARLDVAAGLANEQGATIDSVLEAGGGREIRGSLVNRGLVSAGGGSSVTFTGDLELAGGEVTGNVSLLNPSLRITKSPANATQLLLFGDSTRLLSDNLPKVTLRAIANLQAHAQITVAGNFANHGAIQLESERSDRYARLTVAEGQSFENASDGLIEVRSAGGGGRELHRRCINQGRIHVEPGILLAMNNADAVFTQAAGRIDVEGTLNLSGGRFELLGGVITGSFNTYNAGLFVAAAVSAQQTVFVHGVGSRLAQQFSEAVTLYLTTGVDHQTTLSTEPGAENHGRIVLGSSRSDRTSTINASAGFLNAPSGVVQVEADSGGLRTVTGLVKNQGVFQAPDTLSLSVTGEFEVAGGRNVGPVNLQNIRLRVSSSPPELNELRLYGGGNVLLTDNLPNVALRVVAELAANARLNFPPEGVNRGIVRLVSDRGDRTSTLGVTEATVPLVNADGGRIEVQPGGGGGRSIAAALLNEGTLVVNSGLTVAAAAGVHLNRGRVELGASTMVLSGALFVNQPGGWIVGTGTLDVRNAPFVNAGHISPGSSPGVLTFQGNYSQTLTASVDIEIGGKQPGVSHDQLVVQQGTIALQGGDLNLGAINGFLPEVGDEVVVALAATGLSGQFAGFPRLSFNTNLVWQPVYTATSVKLRAVPADSVLLISRHPSGQALKLGNPLVLQVEALGVGALTYQWRRNGKDIPLATGPELRIPSVLFADAGAYDVVVKSPTSTTTSQAATVSVQEEGAVEDYGDAPTPYPTTGGTAAVHTFDLQFALGSLVDGESGGQPAAGADGDDLGGKDDEDGVEFLTPLVPGQSADLQIRFTDNVHSPRHGYLTWWFDWNGDKLFDNATERRFLHLFTTVSNVTFTVPASAKTGDTYARFRLSADNFIQDPSGAWPNGEVEDYRITLGQPEPELTQDWGDAPEEGTNFPTTNVRNGARHTAVQGFHLGKRVDVESDGQPNDTATGDDAAPPAGPDDEDGVTFVGSITPGSMAQVKVVSSAAGILDAWIDFDNDKTWTNTVDRIFAGAAVNPGNNLLSFPVPPSAKPGTVVSRFRLSRNGVADFGGDGGEGEVEDYAVRIDAVSQCDLSCAGTDFWLAFPGNYSFTIEPVTLRVCLLGTAGATGTATLLTGAAPSNISFAIPATGVFELVLPATLDLGDLNDAVASKSVHIVANSPVTAYAYSQVLQSTDAYLALPTPILGTEYVVGAYGNVHTGVPELNGTQFAITATQPDTVVTVTLPVETGQHDAGQAYEVRLEKAGDTYQIRNTESDAADLTGSLLSASKPIAVFGSHRIANVQSTELFFADYLVEELAPVNRWGREFFTTPLATRSNGDTFRIVASQDNTTVDVGGAPLFIASRGGFAEVSLSTATWIQADAPVNVLQFANSSDYDGVSNADPFMVTVPARPHFGTRVDFCTPSTGFASHYVNVVAPKSSKDLVLLNGATIAPTAFQQIGSSDFYYASVVAGIGTNVVSAPEPVGVIFYGWSLYESYAAPGCLFFGDTVPPVVTCKTNVVVRVIGQPGSCDVPCKVCVPDLREFVSATDNCDALEPSEFQQDPSPGASVGPGTYDVTLRITDDNGNTGECVIKLVVIDPNPDAEPVIECPKDITVRCSSPSGTVVYYDAFVRAGCTELPLKCVPPPGSLFPIGTTQVECEIEKNGIRIVVCRFNVTVDCQVKPSVSIDPVKPAEGAIKEILLQWDNDANLVLEVSDEASGPWVQVPDVVGRYVAKIGAERGKFFRLRQLP